MDFLPEAISQFSEKYTTSEPELLYRLNRQTHINILQPRMLSGHLQGRFLSMISKLSRPQAILEIGTYTGYSALCLAEGLQSGGKLITIDINDELDEFTESYLEQSEKKDLIDFRIGNATEIIPQLDQSFDLVFIDADKDNYPRYFELVIDKMNPGGLIIADNVLWSGKVTKDVAPEDKDTAALIRFCEMVHQDPRVENVLVPIRDGLMMCRVI